MILTRILETCKEVFGQEVLVTRPAYEHFGDYSVNIMQLQARPTEEEIEKYREELAHNPLFEKVERQGAYINLFVHREMLMDIVMQALKDGTHFGKSDWGKGITWAIEHTSPNPNKALHLGHLRNNITGMAISYIWEWAGITVIREDVDNNRGIAIAKLMWGYLQFASDGVATHDRNLTYWYDHQSDWHSPESLSQDPGRFVDNLYVKAAEAYKDDPLIQHEIRQIVIDWEAGDSKTWELWKTVLAYSYAAQEKTLSRLGNKWDTIWHEHEHYERGKQFVEEGLAKGIFVKTDEGTIITNLSEAYGLPDTVIQKSDGTSLYITQDIGLTYLKLNSRHVDHVYWVVGQEQSLALKQLFAVCEQLGIGTRSQLTHIPYGLMTIKGQGRMSSRSGNVVYVDDLLDEAVSQARTAIREPENLIDDIEAVAEAIGIGAIKYSLLRVGREQDIAFDFDDSVTFEGNSGPYIQYAYARIKSILRKTETNEAQQVKLPPHLDPQELLLLRTLTRLEEVVIAAAKSSSPHVICTYAYDLTQAFNAFYEASSILEAPDPTIRAFRLGITQATAHAIQNCLSMLGIATVERM